MPSVLEAGLVRANSRIPDAVLALKSGRRRIDLAGLPTGAAALFLARASDAVGHPMVVVTPDLDEARQVAKDLEFFLGEDSDEEEAAGSVLVFPSADTSPFLDVAPDRQGEMDRLSALFHLSQGLPWRFLVVPAAALLRRLPPVSAIRARSRVVAAEEELDREDFLRLLTEAGYLRTPIAEDPGTFAVRGGIIDVYPPHSRFPARIELDDWLVMSIKLFDPDDQRTIRVVDRVAIHPVRDVLFGTEETIRARKVVRQLCDDVNLPTTQTQSLIEDLLSGRIFYGLDRFLPAFYPELATLFDYLPTPTALVLLRPTEVSREVGSELRRATDDRAAKFEEGAPVFPRSAHYLDAAELLERLEPYPTLVVHDLVVGGAPQDHEPALADFETAHEGDLLHLGGEDQSLLTAQLKVRRDSGQRDEALHLVADRAIHWLDDGMRVLFAARNRTQADRLVLLLRGHDLLVRVPENFRPELLEQAPSGKAEIVIGGLTHGFVLATQGIVFVTEEEVFGARAHRRQSRKSKRERTQPFLEDLRELKEGDYVVHSDHGVGRYLGLTKKETGLSQYERMQGMATFTIEVLVIEYAGGDRLFLPVNRLGQIQKFAAKEGQKPKLDKLGGQTFAKTKAKVRHAIADLADKLLKLYAQRAAATRPALEPASRDYAEFEATFPFEETRDQNQAIADVLEDLQRDQPMDRLVCGDVGFGKTEVALRAAFRIACSGRQVAVLCPTTVLAQQHGFTFRHRLESYPIRIGVLSRFTPKKDQAGILAALKDGTLDVVIGTHRLLSKDVHFANLGLLVIDEEQRFGVTHKERIKQLRTHVDVLTLTATPIPRTLQMAIGGMRDLSLITTPPVDRRAVRTFVSRWDDQVIKEAIQRELARAGQVFFVYNRIEGLYERAHRVQQLVPKAKIAIAHGQMKEGALERTMLDFVEGHHDVLCSTAIVESGLDIPRANTIVIDRADMFGLAQLYQLRGRVGRSRERAYCYLLTPPPSSMTDEARYRIQALERFTELGSGFHVASLDMELRGAGDLLGAEQSGNVALVGMELFVRMLEDAIAQLRGEHVVHEVDPELSVDVEHYIPDSYIDDTGIRLSFYKRLASAENSDAIEEMASEMEDRFGPSPPVARDFVRAMHLKPALVDLRVLGCEASRSRVIFHLREDTPLDPTKVMVLVSQPRSPWKLSPDMKLTCRFEKDEQGDAIDRVQSVLRACDQLRK